MAITVAQMYEVRGCAKLPLPKIIQENIAKLRISPASYRPVKPLHPKTFRPRPVVQPMENWREKKLVEYVRKIKENDDPDYGHILGIFNKITASTLTKLTDDIIQYIEKRDESFRLRVSALLFDKAIVQNAFSSVMADCAKRLVTKVPDVKDDLLSQIEMFPTLYNVDTTLVFPHSSEEDFDNKVIQLFKQKDKRRGYAKFVTQLYVREIVPELIIQASLTNIVDDLLELAKQARTSQIEENVTQFVDFLYETAKALPSGSNLRRILKTSIQTILDMPRTSLPNLCMRARFRLEDTVKCVQ